MTDEPRVDEDRDESDDFSEDEPTRDFVPDLLAHALIMPDPGVAEEPTPTSVVDEWAFSDVQDVDDELPSEMRERISTMPDLSEDVEGPSMTTLRPSAVTLRPKQIQKPSREPWLLAAVAGVALATGAWLSMGGEDLVAPMQAAGAMALDAPVPETIEQGVRLRTAAPGVMATVEGETWGPLPVSLSHLAPGTHRIQFEAAGFHTLERDVVVREGEMAELDITLAAKPVQVVLEVEPPSAFVLVSDTGNLADGRRFPGPWPRIIELEPGDYTFVGFGAGLETVQRKLEVVAGPKASAVRFELPKEDLYE